MKKVLLALAVIATVSSCKEMLKEEIQTDNQNIKVQLLFEHDGCKVYRFYDARWVYYTDCSGSTAWLEKQGKNYVPEEVQTNN